MNGYLSSLLGGLVEGLSAGLPLSENAHRLIFKNLAGAEIPALLPLATALAILIIFHKTFWQCIKGLGQMFKGIRSGRFRWRKATHYQKLALLAPAAAIPYWVLAFLQKQFGLLEGLGTNLLLVGILLILNAGLLFIGDHSEQKHWDGADLTLGHTLKLGLFQAASVLPGFSKLSMTLCMGRNMGFDKLAALEFSMVSLVFAILGGEVIGIEGSIASIASLAQWGVAFGAALLASLVALLLLRRMVKGERLYLLMFYSAIAGIAAIVLNFI